MNKEEQEALELVKEFLKTNGYKGTLECLEKEDSYKSVTEKKSKVTKIKAYKIQTKTIFILFQSHKMKILFNKNFLQIKKIKTNFSTFL